VSDAPADLTPGRRPRISPMGILSLMTIVAMAIVIALMWHEIGPLRAEVRQLRDEVGKLTIDDPTKLAAIQFHRGDDEFMWRWRVWIPAGHSYRLRWVDAAIPRTGFPAPAGFTRALSGPDENVVIYRIDENGWSTLDVLGETIQGNQRKWSTANRLLEAEGVGERTETYDPGEPIVLTRQIGDFGFFSGPVNMEDPTDGFMIWLEPIK
jgi:hypothetical protein